MKQVVFFIAMLFSFSAISQDKDFISRNGVVVPMPKYDSASLKSNIDNVKRAVDSVKGRYKKDLTVIAIGNSITFQSSYSGGAVTTASELHCAMALADGALNFKRMVATTRADIYGVYGYSGQTLPTILTDLDVQIFTPLQAAGIIPDVVFCNALFENDLGQDLTVASMKSSLSNLIQNLQSRWPGVIIHLCTPHLSNSYSTPQRLLNYQQIRDYVLTLDNNKDIFVTKIDLYEDPVAPGMPLGSNFTGSISGTTLTVTAIGPVPLKQGAIISTPTNSTQYGTISYFGTGTGGTGTYTLTASNTVASTSLLGNIYTDGVHPNSRCVLLIAREQAKTIKRYCTTKQAYASISNNMNLTGTATATGTNISGTWSTGYSVAGTPAIAKVVTAEQPFITVKDTAAPVVGSAAVTETGNNGLGSVSFTGVAELAPFIQFKIISGAANIKNISYTPRLTDGSGNNFRNFMVATTNNAEQDFVDGDTLLFRMPSQIPVSGVFTAAQNYFKVIPKLSGGQCTIRILSQGFGVIKKELAGTATLVAGTVTISNQNIQTGNRVFLTVANSAGTQGFLSVPTIVNGTSFTVTSSSSTDTSVINWKIEQ